MQTRIPAEMILAIEERRWNALPGAPYARAFARTLALAYELDPDQIVAGLRADLGERPVQPVPVTESVNAPIDEKDRNKTPFLFVAVIGVALVLVIVATRFLSHSPASTAKSPTDSLGGDSVATAPPPVRDTAPKPPPPPPPPPPPARRTISVTSADSLEKPVFFLYVRKGIPKVRKKTLEGRDSLEFDPDTGTYVRNLTGRSLRLSGATQRDSLDWPFFLVVRKSDSVKVVKIRESDWDEVAGPILKLYRKKSQ